MTCHCFLPQPPGKALTGRSVGPSSALPGDPYNSAAGPADFEISPLASGDSGEGARVRAPERPLPPLPHSRTEVSLRPPSCLVLRAPAGSPRMGERGASSARGGVLIRPGLRPQEPPFGAGDDRAGQRLARPPSLAWVLPTRRQLCVLLCTPGRGGAADAARVQGGGPGWGSKEKPSVPDRFSPSFQLDAGARSTKPVGPVATGGPGEAGPGSGAGPVLQFFTRLRRHASLDGASPYFKVKKWKLDPSQRASSLDTRGERQPWIETRAPRVQPRAALQREVPRKAGSLPLRGLGSCPGLASNTHQPLRTSAQAYRWLGHVPCPRRAGVWSARSRDCELFL